MSVIPCYHQSPVTSHWKRCLSKPSLVGWTGSYNTSNDRGQTPGTWQPLVHYSALVPLLLLLLHHLTLLLLHWQLNSALLGLPINISHTAKKLTHWQCVTAFTRCENRVLGKTRVQEFLSTPFLCIFCVSAAVLSD